MKVAIAGYGIEGKANLVYWLERGDEVAVADERETLDDVPDGVAMIIGDGAFEKLDGFDMVVRTASLRPDKIKTKGKIWSATNEFFAKCPVPIIGVTGTKGKGTTSSLIASILRAADYNVHLVGNIGTPALQILPSIMKGDLVIYELSSFQLWDLEKSPHIAVVLPIEPDHLDVHKDFNEYVNAKANIAKHQTTDDAIVYFEANEYSRKIANMSVAEERAPYPFATDLTSSLVIPGPHNRDNACAAIAAVRDYVEDEAIIRAGLSTFHGLDHRLKFVVEKNSAKYYDDSISTTPGSAIAAVKSFPNVHKIMLLGGSDKGANYRELVDVLSENDVEVIATGTTGRAIASLCDEQNVSCRYVDGAMADLVKSAHDQAKPGDVVVLSPASASFDHYKNYVDRGNQFMAAVEAL